jgi:hypothetical protein
MTQFPALKPWYLAQEGRALTMIRTAWVTLAQRHPYPSFPGKKTGEGQAAKQSAASTIGFQLIQALANSSS